MCTKQWQNYQQQGKNDCTLYTNLIQSHEEVNLRLRSEKQYLTTGVIVKSTNKIIIALRRLVFTLNSNATKKKR
jgi:hypothetical protein